MPHLRAGKAKFDGLVLPACDESGIKDYIFYLVPRATAMGLGYAQLAVKFDERK